MLHSLHNLSNEDYQHLGQTIVLFLQMKGAFDVDTENPQELEGSDANIGLAPKQWYSTDELCQLLNKSAHSIRRLMRKHKVEENKLTKPHLYSKSDVDEIFGTRDGGTH